MTSSIEESVINRAAAAAGVRGEEASLPGGFKWESGLDMEPWAVDADGEYMRCSMYACFVPHVYLLCAPCILALCSMYTCFVLHVCLLCAPCILALCSMYTCFVDGGRCFFGWLN